MKLRILAALFLVPLLFFVVFSAHEIVLTIFIAFFCAIASYELLAVTGLVKNVRLVAYTAVIAFAVPFWSHFNFGFISTKIAILAFFVLLFAEILISHGVIRFDCIAVCVTSGLLIPTACSFRCRSS